MVVTEKDGIQVDKIKRIGYNMDYRANAVFTLPAPSPYPYDIDRDNFFTSFVVLDAIRDPS